MRRRGLSLAEAVLSGLVLALVVAVLAQLYPLAVVSLSRGEHQLQADLWAQSLLDETEAESFDSLPPGQARQLPALRRGGASYAAVIRAYQPPGTDPSVLKALRVEVSWTEKGADRSVAHERWVLSLRQRE
ncbi:MAG: hypothetical protein AB1758_01295 [Candidatus Eremiobacterota bacterium]